MKTLNFFRQASLLALGIATMLPFAGCNGKTPKAAASAPAEPAVGTASKPVSPNINWEAFPSSRRMRLATLPCQCQPKSAIGMHSPLIGVLKVYLNHPQTNLTQGTVWAEFEPDIFKAEADALEETRVKLNEREKLQNELEIPKQKLQLERQIEEASRQVALLNLLSTNPEVAQLSLNVGSSTSTLLRPEALEKARTELGLLNQSMSYLTGTNQYLLGIDLPALKSDLQRRKLEFERRQSQARLKMPFNGQLTVALPLSEGVSEYPVTSGQEVAVARDLSLVRVRIVMSNPAWSTVAPENLEAVVRMPTGSDLTARYVFQKIERVQNREESVYYFQFPSEKAEAASRLIGSDVSAEVWVALPSETRVVPKLSLLMYNPGVFQGRNWSESIAGAWPGAKVIVEGQTDLAVASPHKTALVK